MQNNLENTNMNMNNNRGSEVLRVILAVVISTLIFVGWQYFFPQPVEIFM